MKENKINLIGISGRKRNGKDLSIELINEILAENNKLQYERKAFAGKLKEIATMLTGVTGWETEEDKAKELGPEWDYWALKIEDFELNKVTISGVYKSKQEALAAFEKIPKAPYDAIKAEAIFISMTRRVFLQKLGSDACNQNVHSNIWINALFADYKVKEVYASDYDNPNKYDDPERIYYPKPELIYPNWMVCDVRFPQEVDSIKERNGKVIRVIRPDKYNHGDVHISETALDHYKDFDYFVYNDGTVEELKEKLRIIVKELGLI